MKNLQVFGGIFSKGGARKNRSTTKRIRRDIAAVGEVEGNSKIKTRLELQLNGKEAKNSRTSKLTSNLEPAFLSLTGDS